MVYLGPGFQYVTDNTGDSQGKGHNILTGQLKLGLQYNFSRSFALYGDTGFGMISDYDHNTTTDDTKTYIGFFGAFAGLVIYF